MNPPLVRLDNMGHSYALAEGKEQRVLSSINLEINENEFICISGANGSGKSTLLKILSKRIIPSEGNVLYRDENLTSIKRRDWMSCVGMIHQNPEEGLAVKMTVKENLLLSKMKNYKLTLQDAYSQSSVCEKFSGALKC